MPAPLRKELRERIITLHKNGYTVSQIGRMTGSSRKTIYLWLQRWKEGDASPRVRTHFPRGTTAEQDNDIIAAHKADPFRSTVVTSLEYNISSDTVRRRLRAAGLRFSNPTKKLPLGNEYRQDRVSFCLQYSSFDWEDRPVIFIGEKCFESDKDGHIILYTYDGDHKKSRNILHDTISDRINLGFWGWMSSAGPGELVEVSGAMTAEQYVEFLRDTMVPTVRLHYPDTIHLVHDNVSVHREPIVQEWLERQKDIEVIEWPPKSLDLYPFEKLWEHMMLNWDPSEVCNNESWSQLVFNTWESMRGKEFCWELVTGMRRRLGEVLEANGEHVK